MSENEAERESRVGRSGSCDTFLRGRFPEYYPRWGLSLATIGDIELAIDKS